MTYSDSTHAGSPFGARWDDNYHTGPAPRTDRYAVQHPWGAAGCDDCQASTTRGSRHPGCTTCYPVRPPKEVPGGPGAGESTPCVGKWDLFDTEEPGPEALSLCASCPFQNWCADTATANSEWGIWGGLNREDRLNLTRGDLAA